MMDTPESARALGSRYQLTERIGRGATGEVWRAWDRVAEKDVAAKLLWPQYATDHEVVTRFIQERTILTNLKHPHIVQVLDLVVEGDNLAIVMDLVPGPTLAQVRRSFGTLSAALAIPPVIMVLDALAYAHQQGVLHRDIKPDNILLADAEPSRLHDIRLSDFGIARLAHDPASGTEVIGTPHYMPPEMISYGKFVPTSDVYSTGIVLYELLAGRTPFAGAGTDVTIGLRHVESAPPPLALHPELGDVLARMLAKDPRERWSAARTAVALRALPAEALTAEPLPPLAEPKEWDKTAATMATKAEIEQVFGVTPTGALARPTTGFNPDATEVKATAPGRSLVGLPADPTAPGPGPVVDSLPAWPGSDLIDGLPAWSSSDHDNLTRVKADTHHAVQVNLPEVAPTAPSRKKWFIIGGAGLGVILVTGLVLWLTGVFGGEPPKTEITITTVASHLTGQTLPTGLRIDLDASYQATEQLTRLQVTLATAPTAGLAGDVLLVIPGLGDQCPEVSSTTATAPIKASSDGLDLPCGHKLIDLALAAGSNTVVDIMVDLDLVGADASVPADYSDWLTSIDRATDSALRTITGTSFPIQRVSALYAQPETVTLLEADGVSVPYKVYARWSSGPERTADSNILSQEVMAGMETDTLLDLTGRAGVDGVSIETCNEAQRNGIRIIGQQPTDSCFLRVRVGLLDSGQANFGIRLR